jgi:hypothetical protein
VTCVHCERAPRGAFWRYSMSGAIACLRCVSFPSAPATDALLYAMLA